MWCCLEMAGPESHSSSAGAIVRITSIDNCAVISVLVMIMVNVPLQVTTLTLHLRQEGRKEGNLYLAKYCITLYFRGRKISRKVNFKYFRENILFTRKFLPAKISSRENIFSRKYPLAKISSRENILPRKSFACFVSVASFSLFAAR